MNEKNTEVMTKRIKYIPPDFPFVQLPRMILQGYKFHDQRVTEDDTPVLVSVRVERID